MRIFLFSGLITIFCIACRNNDNQNKNSGKQDTTIQQSQQRQEQDTENKQKSEKNIEIKQLFIFMDSDQYDEEEVNEVLAEELPYIYKELKENYTSTTTSNETALLLTAGILRKSSYSRPLPGKSSFTLPPATFRQPLPESTKNVRWKQDQDGSVTTQVKLFELDEATLEVVLARKKRKDLAAAEKALIERLTSKPVIEELQSPRASAPTIDQLTSRPSIVQLDYQPLPRESDGPKPAWAVYATF